LRSFGQREHKAEERSKQRQSIQKQPMNFPLRFSDYPFGQGASRELLAAIAGPRCKFITDLSSLVYAG